MQIFEKFSHCTKVSKHRNRFLLTEIYDIGQGGCILPEFTLHKMWILVRNNLKEAVFNTGCEIDN